MYGCVSVGMLALMCVHVARLHGGAMCGTEGREEGARDPRGSVHSSAQHPPTHPRARAHTHQMQQFYPPTFARSHKEDVLTRSLFGTLQEETGTRVTMSREEPVVIVEGR